MRKIWISGFALCIFITLLALTSSPVHTAGFEKTTFIDVGEGDSILLQDGTGFNVLIDGGKAGAGPTVVAELHERGIDDLSVVLASHADADHIGGLIDVLQDPGFAIHQVDYNGYEGTTKTWEDFKSAAAARGLALTAVQFPAELTWGAMQVYVLNPATNQASSDTNKISLVLRVDYGNTKELFTGDIDATIEATVVARQTPVAAQILKVAHHGSAGSSSAAFLAAVHPEVGVISVGPNGYGHPSEQTLQRLEQAGVGISRTDLQGDIEVDSDGSSYVVLPKPSSPTFLWLPVVMQGQ